MSTHGVVWRLGGMGSNCDFDVAVERLVILEILPHVCRRTAMQLPIMMEAHAAHGQVNTQRISCN